MHRSLGLLLRRDGLVERLEQLQMLSAQIETRLWVMKVGWRQSVSWWCRACTGEDSIV